MRLKDKLSKIGVEPRKSRGQNFLKDPNLALRIIEFSGIQAGDIVLEIGPGLGALTRHLASLVKTLYCVEVEAKFCSQLVLAIPLLKSENVICCDIRKLDPKVLNADSGLMIISNLPYSISSEVIQWLIINRAYIRGATLLLQREFAERICAKVNSKTYGSLSVWVQLFCDACLGDVVSGAVFHPPTKVDSRLVRLTLFSNPRYDDAVDLVQLQRVLKGAFSVRRKTIVNSLLNAKVFGSRNDILNALKNAEIDERCRAENITIEGFVRLAEALRHT